MTQVTSNLAGYLQGNKLGFKRKGRAAVWQDFVAVMHSHGYGHLVAKAGEGTPTRCLVVACQMVAAGKDPSAMFSGEPRKRTGSDYRYVQRACRRGEPHPGKRERQLADVLAPPDPFA